MGVIIIVCSFFFVLLGLFFRYLLLIKDAYYYESAKIEEEIHMLNEKDFNTIPDKKDEDSSNIN